MKKTLFLSIIALSSIGCTSPDIQQASLPADAYISLYDTESIQFKPLGNSVTLSFTAAGNWTLSTTDPCFSLDKDKGKEGKHDVTVTADINRTEGQRTGQLTFSCVGGPAKTIELLQDNPYLRMKIIDGDGHPTDRDTVVMLWNDSEEGSARQFHIDIESNVDWKIDLTPEDDEVFVLQTKKGKGDADIPIRIAKNNTDRQPYFAGFYIAGYMDDTFSNQIGAGIEQYRARTFRQNNLRFLLNDSCLNDPNVVINELNDSIVVDNTESLDSIVVDSELPWMIKEKSDWLSVNRTDGPEGQSTLRVCAVDGTEAKPGVNPFDHERPGTIVLLSEGGAERNISVTQDAYIFEALPPSVKFPNNEDNIELPDAISFNSSGPWTIQDDGFPDWMEVSPMSGDKGKSSITLKNKKQNLKLSDDEHYISIKSGWNSLERKVKVSQAKFDFEYSFPDGFEAIPATADKEVPYELYIKSSGKWKLESGDSWLEFSKYEGRGRDTVKFYSSSVNPDMTKDRQANITFTSITHKEAGEDISTKFKITQEKFKFKVEIIGNPVAPAFTVSKKLILKIDCSDKWKIESCPSWLTADKSSGRFDSLVHLTPETNISIVERTGTITILSEYNNKRESISVRQDGFVFKTYPQEFKNLPAINVQEQNVKLDCTEEAGWNLSTDKDWITIVNPQGTGNATLNFTIKDNPYTSARNGKVTINSGVDGVAAQTISFSQKAFVFDSDARGPYSFKAMPAASDSYSFSVRSTGAWDIKADGDKSWLTFSKDHSNGTETGEEITLQAKANTSTSPRTVQVYVRSAYYPSNDELQKTFSVTQDAYVWNVEANKTDFTYYNEYGTQNGTITINCTGSWSIDTGGCNWLTFTPKSGKNHATVIVKPSSNQDKERKATITVKCDDNASLSKDITYTQTGFKFEVDETSADFPAEGGNGNFKVSCSTTWTAFTSNNWIHVKTINGTAGDDKPMEFTVDENGTKDTRSGTITIKPSHFEKVITVTVTQEK